MEYKLHVFIDHDPIYASIFLHNVFADFPESAWRLPQRSVPPRPKGDPRPPDGRLALGRYVFPEAVPSSTTVGEVASRMEKEFSIHEKWQSHFTIFPASYMPFDGYPPWQGKPLPRDTTLGEVQSLDETWLDDYDGEDKQVVHLVLATKATQLGRILTPDFLPYLLSQHSFERGTFWDKLDHFHVGFNADRDGFSELADALKVWRHNKYAQVYFVKCYDPPIFPTLFPPLEDSRLMTKYKREKADAKSKMANLAREWKRLIPTSPLNDDFIDKCLQEDSMEQIARPIWKQKLEMVNEWKDSERGKSMLQFLKDEKERRHKAPNPWIIAPSSGAEEHEKPETPIRDTPNPRLEAFSIRSEDELLSPAQSSFTNKSGIMLWGQLRNIFYGSRTDRLTNNSSLVPTPLPGGTIIQRIRSYRSACRTGDWKIRRYHSSLSQKAGMEGGLEGAPTSHVGWVFYHESFDPCEIIRRVRAINEGRSISNDHNHPDKGVLYIGRYDWSYHWKDPEDPEFDKKFVEFVGDIATARTPIPLGYDGEPDRLALFRNPHFMAIDADRWDQRAVEMHKSGVDKYMRSSTVERVFGESEIDKFGGYVQKEDTEYEFGWLVFSGNKVGEHEADELIGIVYDGSYEVFEGLRHSVEGEDLEA